MRRTAPPGAHAQRGACGPLKGEGAALPAVMGSWLCLGKPWASSSSPFTCAPGATVRVISPASHRPVSDVDVSALTPCRRTCPVVPQAGASPVHSRPPRALPRSEPVPFRAVATAYFSAQRRAVPAAPRSVGLSMCSPPPLGAVRPFSSPVTDRPPDGSGRRGLCAGYLATVAHRSESSRRLSGDTP